MSEPSLLLLADSGGHEQRLLRDDLRAMLFPASARPPSERQIAELRRYIARWVAEIEDFLLSSQPPPSERGVLLANEPRQAFPACWTALGASGLLSDDDLLQQAMTLAFLKRVHAAGEGGSTQDQVLAYLGNLVEHGDAATPGEGAKLLAAYLRLSGKADPAIAELPAAMLNKLGWRVVAAHEVLKPGMRDALSPKVTELLSRHDESRALLKSAHALAHQMFAKRLVSTERPELAPERQGLALTLALLSVAADVPYLRVTAMVDDWGLSRLALLLRALDYHPREARRVLGWLGAHTGGQNAVMTTLGAYEVTAQAAAEAMLAKFRVETSDGEADQ